jgi:uncharacterized membrane protein YbhN (UPF0104 family)
MSAHPAAREIEIEATTPDHDARRLRGGLLWAAGLALLCTAVALAVPDLRDVLRRAARAHAGWLVLAVVLEIGSCLGYVAVVRLVLHRGPARDVRRLAWAEMAFGAVVPLGGAGGLAVGAWAMRAWGIGWERVANRSAVIFLLTSAVNTAVLALSGLGVLVGLGAARTGLVLGLVPLASGAGAIAAFALLPRLAKSARLQRNAPRAAAAVARTGVWVSDTLALVRGASPKLAGAVAYLLLDIAALWACLRAVGQAPPILALVAGYQIGYLSNLVPIPGAIGVLDGGLLAALVLYGLPAAPTAAGIVIYHALALWVPSLGGTVGFLRLRRSLTRTAPNASNGDEPAAELRPELPGETPLAA